MKNLPKYIEEAIHHYFPHMQGWTTPERGCEIASRIIETNAQVCIDIGTFAGRSAIAMGFAARQLNSTRVYSIDPWNVELADENDDHKEGVDWWKEKVDLEDIHRQAMRAIWGHHLEPWVTIIRAKSEHVHQLFPTIDVLNIDGAHGEKASCRDVELYLPKVRQGGIVFMDDTDWPTTQKALSMIEESCELLNTVKDKNESRTYRKR